MPNMISSSYKQSHIIILIPNLRYVFYINWFTLSAFRQPQYEPYYRQNFRTTKDFVVYAAETYSTSLYLLGLLQPLCFKPFPNFLKNNSNRNTYEYTVFFRAIMESDVTNMKGNVIWNNDTIYGKCWDSYKQK